MKHKVLSTKKLDPAVLRHAMDSRIELIEINFISIRPAFTEAQMQAALDWTGKNHASICFTSANAVKLVEAWLNEKGLTLDAPLFCLDGKTGQAIMGSKALTGKIVAMARDGASLASEIKGIQHLLFFCGNIRLDTIPKAMEKSGIELKECIVYRTEPTPEKVSGFDGVVFFSPSAVQSFFSLNTPDQDVNCFAIGTTTAASLHQHTIQNVITADAHDETSMIEKVIEYFAVAQKRKTE